MELSSAYAYDCATQPQFDQRLRIYANLKTCSEFDWIDCHLGRIECG
jgi:hypothetical protein